MITAEDIHKRIAEELDITHLPQEAQEKVADELGGMLYQRMLLAIFDKVPPMQQEELKRLIATDAEDAITELIQKHVPHVAQVIEEEFAAGLADYREALQNSAA